MKFFKRSKSPQQDDHGERRAAVASSAELERRIAPRFAPGDISDDGLVVHVSGPSLGEAWEVNDLSTTGLSLHLDPEDEREFPRDGLRVQFELPGDDEPFDLGVRVVHDTVLRGARRIGLSFDPSRTPELERIQARILDHFVGRYRVQLRGRDGATPGSHST